MVAHFRARSRVGCPLAVMLAGGLPRRSSESPEAGSDEGQATVAVDAALKAFGRIDVLVNNAGYSLLGNFEALSTAEIQRHIATNFYGVMFVMRAVLPVMRKQRSGRIIKLSSLAGM